MNELDIFTAAIAFTDPVERIAFLDRECAGNTALRKRLDALLAGNEQSHHPLDHPPADANATATFGSPSTDLTASYTSNVEAVGAVIAGKYTLVEVVGEGGMGSVWRAKQTEPVKRLVAVKLIKAGMDSKSVLARFDAERQALALMDHPNIAKVLDGGVHDYRPYFVMELVRGTPITEYCDKCKLTPQQRLELFVQVCQAIQHAHQKGIIHRDIKPSNVLIALYDEKPVVKVIDFGVAKATGGALTEHTIDTGFGGVVGTPQYMSPEQATFNNLDIDTRSDVYALGVLLYELLAGSPPFSGADLKKKGLLEILRVVREEEPPRPSTKLSTADALPSLSANRGTEPKKLTGLLRNELDWIVMKALEKDRTRRYETANGFAADVLRYLSGEAVQAHPLSAVYRLKKFVRRNKGQVIAASLVLLALVAGVIGTTIGLFEAVRQEKLARKAQEQETEQRQIAESERDEREKARLIAVAEKERADREKAIAEAVKDFVTNDIFGRAGDETLGQSSDIKASTLLEKAAENVGDKFKDQPEIELAVRNSLAYGFKSVGQLAKCTQQLERVLELCRCHRAKDDELTLAVLDFLAHITAGTEKSLTLMKESVDGLRRKYGESDTRTLNTTGNLVFIYEKLFRYSDAVAVGEEALRTSDRVHGPESKISEVLRAKLSRVYPNVGRIDEAIRIASDIYLARVNRHGVKPLSIFVTGTRLVDLYMRNRQYALAETLGLEMLNLGIQIYGPNHIELSYFRTTMADIYRMQGKNLEAGIQYLDISYAQRQANGPKVDWGRVSQGFAVAQLKAANRLDVAIQRAEAWAGSDNPDQLANAVSLYGMIAKQTKDKALAEKSLIRGIEILRRAVARGWTDATRAAYEFEAYHDREDFQEILAKLGKQKPNGYSKVIAGLARSYFLKNEYEKALKFYLDSIPLQEVEVAKDPKNDGLLEELAYQYDHLGDTYYRLKQFEKAIASHRQGFVIRDRLYKECPTDQKRKFGDYAAWSLHSIGKDLLASEKPVQAAVKFHEAATLRLLLILGPQVNNSYSMNLRQDYDSEARSWMAAAEFHKAEVASRRAYDVIHDIVKSDFSISANRAHLDNSQQQLADILNKLHRSQEAAELLKDNVDLYRKTNPESLDDALARLGLTHLSSQSWIDAETILKECLELRQKMRPDEWRTYNTRSMLGEALLGLKKYTDAEPLLLTGYDGMKAREMAIPPAGIICIPESLDRLIAIYTATKKPDEVNKYRELRAKYPPEIAPPPREFK